MRRKYITHPLFQIGFTTSFVIGFLLVITLIGTLFVTSLYLLGTDPMLTSTQRQILMDGAYALSGKLFLFTVILGGIFLALGIYLSYKFVGPLNRLESWLKERIEMKNYTPLQLRPGDEMEPLVVVLNRLVSTKFK